MVRREKDNRKDNMNGETGQQEEVTGEKINNRRIDEPLGKEKKATGRWRKE